MAFGGFDSGNPQPMSEINVTPLVDVMLVLLVIFMVTAPLLTHAIKIDLPQAQQRVNVEKPDTITLALDAQGRAFWNDQLIADADLPARFAEVGRRRPQPELHLRADRNTRYQQLAEVMAAIQNAGMEKVGFITNPNEKH